MEYHTVLLSKVEKKGVEFLESTIFVRKRLMENVMLFYLQRKVKDLFVNNLQHKIDKSVQLFTWFTIQIF